MEDLTWQKIYIVVGICHGLLYDLVAFEEFRKANAFLGTLKKGYERLGEEVDLAVHDILLRK